MFSARTGWPLKANRLHQLAATRRAAGTLVDLTVTNPTACGFEYPRERMLAALGAAAALTYEPHPLGLVRAREAVAAYYADRGIAVPVDRLVLTASTSEAYAHLFRLLCDPGDDVLMPAPSYPLFEMLAGLNDVRLTPAPMWYDHGWHLDRDALLAAAGPRTRALLLVHPNNPAGNYIKPAEWEWLQAEAAARGWAVVVDEVFWDYAIPPESPVGLDYAGAPALTFVLNGLSKISALPQMKLGWIAVFGSEDQARAALARLEVVNDLFLSVDAPIQHAAATLLAARATLQPQIRARLVENLAALDAALAAAPDAGITRLKVEGGWAVILRLPRIHSDEEWAELALERAGVLTHPGHFYSLPADAHLVVSLLTSPKAFAVGADRILEVIAEESQA